MDKVKINTFRDNFIDLTESKGTKIAHIEFTSRCNLRCVFCASSQPGYKGEDLDPLTLDLIIPSLKQRHIKIVSVNGHGETTIYKNWYRYCDEFIKEGISLHIISNMAKELSQAEISTLSHFRDIEISCDTADPDLFKDLRRGADLKTIENNIMKIRSFAKKESQRIPNMSFSCVINDKNIFKLRELVSYGMGLHIIYFNFCNLIKYPDLNSISNVNHISELPESSIAEAKHSLDSTFALLKNANIGFSVQKGLLDSLNEKSQKTDVATIPAEPFKEEIKGELVQSPKKYSKRKQAAQTRDCLDPWEFILVKANRDILPCCWHQPIGTLNSGLTLSEVVNNPRSRELRKSLLDGELSDDCLNCPSKGFIPTKKLRNKVLLYHISIHLRSLFSHKKHVVLPSGTVEIRYGEGWYSLENDPAIKNPYLRHWRWTSKSADCIVMNQKKDLLFSIAGGTNKAVFPDQKIIIKVQDKIIDEFIPDKKTFAKDYLVYASTIGNDNELHFVIETDKTFIPQKINSGSTDNRELGIQVFSLSIAQR